MLPVGWLDHASDHESVLRHLGPSCPSAGHSYGDKSMKQLVSHHASGPAPDQGGKAC